VKDAARRNAIKAFLRARRAAISPEELGLERGKRRLTPGLRREEVALLAGVGITWYTWLEQGRDTHFSLETLGRVARALRLTRSDEEYLFSLANVALPSGTARVRPSVPPVLQSLLDGFTSGPALVFSPFFDVLAYNALARVIYSLDVDFGPFGHNHLWRLFMDPTRQRLYVDWETGARNLVGLLRRNSAADPGGFEAAEVFIELRAHSPEFVRIWEGLETKPLAHVTVQMMHPLFGRFAVNSVRLFMQEEPDLLVVLLPPADAESAVALIRPRS
jgi:transcription regulator MmyB-like protein/helix-turn-helix protein